MACLNLSSKIERKLARLIIMTRAHDIFFVKGEGRVCFGRGESRIPRVTSGGAVTSVRVNVSVKVVTKQPSCKGIGLRVIQRV